MRWMSESVIASEPPPRREAEPPKSLRDTLAVPLGLRAVNALIVVGTDPRPRNLQPLPPLQPRQVHDHVAGVPQSLRDGASGSGEVNVRRLPLSTAASMHQRQPRQPSDVIM